MSKGTVSSNLTASAILKHIVNVFDTKAGQAGVLQYGELAELGLRQRFAKPSTMSSGSLVRIQYSPPKNYAQVPERSNGEVCKTFDS